MKHVICTVLVFAAVLALAACAAPAPAGPAAAQEKAISQVRQGAITVDGDLKDWPARAWLPVDQSMYGGAWSPSPDLDVKAAFAFDADRFYLSTCPIANSPVGRCGWGILVISYESRVTAM